ncbi:hypothetical protein ABZ471_33795 [Streptomyces sp. NPDC005728]|uniref:sodium:solute symporter family transporter n=1 Tax=Streptomyces sp. NPDC005728 TaxID=3157054 RepID=UPI0033DA5730
MSSVALTEDFYRAFLNRRASGRALVWVGRAAVVAVTLVAFVIALSGGRLLGIVGYARAGFGAAFGPVVLLSMYLPRITWAGAMAGIGGSRITLPRSGPLRTGRAGFPRIRLKQAPWTSQVGRVRWPDCRRRRGAGGGIRSARGEGCSARPCRRLAGR